jgi:hypothetical protein
MIANELAQANIGMIHQQTRLIGEHANGVSAKNQIVKGIGNLLLEQYKSSRGDSSSKDKFIEGLTMLASTSVRDPYAENPYAMKTYSRDPYAEDP